MNIYIISLIRDEKKRAEISRVLNELNLNYEFIDAVYGKDLPRDSISNLNVKGKISRRGYVATPGEIGCSFSHIKAMKEIVKSDTQWGCILEDDVILDERFKKFILSANESLYSEKDVYVLGGQNGLGTEKFISKSFFTKKIIGSQIFSKVVKSQRYVNRACCYVISTYSAKKYIDYAEKNYFLADDWNLLYINNIFSNIYLANFVDHPLDLVNSNIESERKEGQKSIAGIKSSKIYKFFKFFYVLLKVFTTQIKRFLF
jgi:GR25 family glycosyltransferase involved in LPS biosynthesis